MPLTYHRRFRKPSGKRDVNADVRRNADELRRQMDEMQPEATDHGLLLTLDDASFVTNMLIADPLTSVP